MCLFSFHLHFISIAIHILMLFSYPYMAQKILFLDQILETDFLMELHVLRSPESENHIFGYWSFCVCERKIDFNQHNSKTNNSRMLKFSILNMYYIQMSLDLSAYRQTQKISNALWSMSKIPCYCSLTSDCTKSNKMTIKFSYALKDVWN